MVSLSFHALQVAHQRHESSPCYVPFSGTELKSEIEQQFPKCSFVQNVLLANEAGSNTQLIDLSC